MNAPVLAAAAVGPEELLVAAAGADVGNIDVIGQNIGPQQHGVGDVFQVDAPFFPFPVHIFLHHSAKGRPHGLGNIVVGDEAGAADGGTHGRDEFMGIGAVDRVHLLNGLADDLLSDAPPARMDHSAGLVFVIVEHHQLAVGIKARQHHAGDVSHQRIHPVAYGGEILQLFHHGDVVGVLLGGAGDMMYIGAQDMGGDIVILHNAFPVVRAGKAKVQAFINALGDAALPGEKAMPQPGIDGKLRRGEINQIVGDLLAKFRHIAKAPSIQK